jgi:predicted nuclease of restriction endonuclease-like (RecB) superfamily
MRCFLYIRFQCIGTNTISHSFPSMKTLETNNDALLSDLRILISTAQERIATSVNAELTMLYWHIGRRIRIDILQEERAKYGDEIVQTLAVQLTTEFGKGFTTKSLRNMIHFAEVFSDEQIVSTLWRQFTWSHFRELMYIKEPLKREFYIEICRLERWSVRTLRERINSLLFERTAISRKPEETIVGDIVAAREHNVLSPAMVFRDPYILDFLGLHDSYNEKDLESAILRDLEAFLLELGSDFAFVARQKRITIDNEDYYLDLLFYNRRLMRLVAIELKMGKFQAADKGQMELYLRWLDKYERQENENPPLGLILCAEKNDEHVELLELSASGIHVAQYMTHLPEKQLLERKLRSAIEQAQRRLR